MPKSFAFKNDAICPCCGRELIAHHVGVDTRSAQNKRKAALAALPPGSAEHTLLLAQQAREIVRILLTRKHAGTAQTDVVRTDRKKLH